MGFLDPKPLTSQAAAAQASDPATPLGAALSATIVDLHVEPVAGTDILAVTHGHTYEVTATANAVVTLTGAAGSVVAVAILPSAFTVTIEGNALTAGTYVAHKVTAGWMLYPVGGAPAGDTTDPTAGTLGVSVGTTTADLTVTGALDETALHATPYRYSKDNGATWTAWQAGNTYNYTGLTADTSYPFRHEIRDEAGNTKLGTAVTTSTAAVPVWDDVFTENFTGLADATALNGRTTETGAIAYHSSTTATVTGERAYQNTHIATGVLAIPYATSNSLRFTGAYEVGTISASNGMIRLGIAFLSGLNNQYYFAISHASGSATISFTDFGPGLWTATIPTATGHPLSGTFEMVYNTAGKSGTFSINDVQVATFSGDTVVNPTGFYATVQNNFSALDNLRGEVSSV